MIEAFLQALYNLTDPGLIFYTCLGIILGLFVGALPAVGGLVAMAMILPFSFWMKPLEALPFIVTVATVCGTGGAMTAILMNIPGDEVNAVTILDGFPMTQRGEGTRAVGAALMSSTLGGILSVFLTFAMIPVTLFIVTAVSSADMVFVILMGISFMAGERGIIKNLISGVLGLLISLVGFQAVTGSPRFTFGSPFLYSGFALVPVIVGLFALPEAIELAATGSSLAEKAPRLGRIEAMVLGTKDCFHHWGLFLRSTLIGWIVGVIPGIGGIVAAFVSYGQARSTSKYPEKFGTGVVEGVIAPQSALTAVQGGSLLTTLAFGIPGSAGGVIILGAFVLLGLVPGPTMLTEHLDLSLTLLFTIIISCIIGGAICFWTIPWVAKIVLVPSRILFPSLVVLGLVGTFLNRGEFGDVIVAAVFTLLGVGMSRLGYSRSALLLGFILGGLFEKYLFIALAADGPFFFLEPIPLLLIAIIIFVLGYQPLKKRLSKKGKKV